MLNYLDALILGAIQGLTEFFPISSSGHLVVFSSLISDKPSPLYFDIAVHAGSLLALLIYFRRELLKILGEPFENFQKLRNFSNLKNLKLFVLLIATIPVVVVAVSFNNLIDSLFQSPLIVSYMLFVTALLLFIGEYILSKFKSDKKEPNTFQAFIIGIFQALALIPGISRSGSTISGGLLMGLSREQAARFSFILAIPALFGALLFESLSTSITADQAGILLTGFTSSFIISLFAIVFLLKYVRNHSLYVFSVYCFLLGIIAYIVVR